MKILESLEWRYATKKFDPSQKLSEEQVQGLLHVLNLTPTSYGLQPLKFLRVKNESIRKELTVASWNQKQVEDASDLLIICIENQLVETDIDHYIELICKKRNQDPKTPRFDSFKSMLMKIVEWPEEDYHTWAKKQAYIALGNLMTACAIEKIDACPMEGFEPNKYDEILNLKEKGLQSVLVCPVGYRSQEDAVADLNKVRKDINEITIEI
jgi:nitroreductase